MNTYSSIHQQNNKKRKKKKETRNTETQSYFYFNDFPEWRTEYPEYNGKNCENHDRKLKHRHKRYGEKERIAKIIAKKSRESDNKKQEEPDETTVRFANKKPDAENKTSQTNLALKKSLRQPNTQKRRHQGHNNDNNAAVVPAVPIPVLVAYCSSGALGSHWQ